MKIIEAINRIDSLKHNTYTQPEKIAWLSTLDAMAKAHVIDTHEGGENVAFNGYDQNTDLNTVLLIPAPYEEAYLKWLEAQIDYANGEYGKYNNAIESFNTFWNGYKNYYNRTHMPLRNHVRFFGGHPKPNSGSPQVNQAAIERILTKIGDMNKLNTENKETLVAAINEALRGGADREEIKRIVDSIQFNVDTSLKEKTGSSTSLIARVVGGGVAGGIAGLVIAMKNKKKQKASEEPTVNTPDAE
jgi:hypothetical protein